MILPFNRFLRRQEWQLLWKYQGWDGQGRGKKFLILSSHNTLFLLQHLKITFSILGERVFSVHSKRFVSLVFFVESTLGNDVTSTRALMELIRLITSIWNVPSVKKSSVLTLSLCVNSSQKLQKTMDLRWRNTP